MTKIFQLLIFSLLFLTLSKGSYGQYTDTQAIWNSGGFETTSFIHTDELCSVTSILEHPTSIEALRVYRELRIETPYGALTESLHSNAQVGDTRTFRVRNIQNQSQWITTNFTLRSRDEQLLIWVEDGEFAENKVNQRVVDGLMTAMRFETPSLSIDPNRGILDIGTEYFGDLPNVDGSNTLNILITDINDGWTPGSQSFIAGFFDPVDLNPDNPNSNGTDIIYLNSRPLIYQDGSELINETRVRSVAAHELQHLIHANYGNLQIFQNEGQSEYAELLTGYNGRVPNYLTNPIEYNRPFFLWRGQQRDGTVLRDYERAANFHMYMSERVGPEATGSITRAQSPFIAAYNSALAESGLNFEDILLDFHISNYINNTNVGLGQFGFQDVRRSGFRTTEVTFRYLPGQTMGSGNREVEYAGVNYIEWNGVEDLELSISGDGDIRFALITIPLGERENVLVSEISPGGHFIEGQFERIILVATATDTGIGGFTEPDVSFYSYESTWSTLPLIYQNLTYAAQPSAFQEIPGDQTDTQRQGIMAMAKRFSPEFDAIIEEIEFIVNGRDTSVLGAGSLLITVNQAEAVSGGGFRPGDIVHEHEIPIARVVRGLNTIDVSTLNWQVEAEEDFFVIFSVSDLESRIEFLIDEGTQSETNPNYNPTRTLIFVEPPSSQQAGWFRYGNRNNLVASVRLFAEYDGPLVAPEITQQPINTQVAFDEEAVLSVQFTGIPQPLVQWFKDGEPVYGQRDNTLVIERFSQEDSGTYTALIANPAGVVESNAVILSPSIEKFEILPNYPNPVTFDTRIRFILPEDSQVHIDLYNIQGQRVGSVLPDTFFPEGLNEINYMPVNLASGLYFYRIRAKAVNVNRTFNDNGSMIILRR